LPFEKTPVRNRQSQIGNRKFNEWCPRLPPFNRNLRTLAHFEPEEV